MKYMMHSSARTTFVARSGWRAVVMRHTSTSLIGGLQADFSVFLFDKACASGYASRILSRQFASAGGCAMRSKAALMAALSVLMMAAVWAQGGPAAPPAPWRGAGPTPCVGSDGGIY